jgi:hypothetical protein
MGELCSAGQTRNILNLMCGDARNPRLAHTTMSRGHAPTAYSFASGVESIEGLPSNAKREDGKGRNAHGELKGTASQA